MLSHGFYPHGGIARATEGSLISEAHSDLLNCFLFFCSNLPVLHCWVNLHTWEVVMAGGVQCLQMPNSCFCIFFLFGRMLGHHFRDRKSVV